MRLTKLHGLGNDYLFYTPSPGEEEQPDWSDLARRASDRHFGVGADGLILALPSAVADLRMRIFNADGSEAEMCGNGIRCLAKYAVEERLVDPTAERLRIETLAGILTIDLVRQGGEVVGARVDMGQPRLRPVDIPVAVEGEGPILDYPLVVDGVQLRLAFVSMGNPHAVHFVETDPDEFPLERIGPLVEHHPLFPRRTNFQVVQVLDRHRVKHRVWERGAGLTLASGTSAAAVCVAGCLKGLLESPVVDSLPGGELLLEWDGKGSVFMTGPAVRVFDAEWNERAAPSYHPSERAASALSHP